VSPREAGWAVYQFGLLSLLFLALVGCGVTGLINRTEPLKDEPAGRKYLDLLIQGQVDEIEKDLDPTVADVDTKEKLVQIAEWLPAEAPKSVKVVDSRTISRVGYSETQLGYECEFEDSWYLVTMSLTRKQNAWAILGLHVNRLPDSLENMHKFTVAGKGLSQYLTLLLALGSLTLSFYAFWECVRTRVGPSRWLWTPFILTGVGGLFVNWTTGQMGFQIWFVHIPTAIAEVQPFGPWMIGVSLPLGAMIFLNERWREKVLGEPLSESDQKVRAAMDELREK
jgi:hypothetical protein